MKKFAFIGAGSFIFTRNLVRDLLSFPAFEDCELALMDTDPERLERITAAVRKINAAMGAHAKIAPTQSRAEALSGADGVLCTVFNGGIDVWRYDIEIPMQFGVDINIGDTRSVSGIFRALRNIPLMLDICRDIEKYCPNAVFLNYTNPMSMLCKAMQTETNVEVTGLCHSVQVCSEKLLEKLGMEDKLEGRRELIAGINHMGWLLELHDKDGNDLYPEIRRRAAEKNATEKHDDMVRFEYIKHLGYYCTESSEHNAEYNPLFIKSRYPEMIEKYNIPLDEYPRRCVEQIKGWEKEREDILKDGKVTHERSKEYASYIMEAVVTGNPYKIGGNVLNTGLIDNLPSDACVEVPCMVDANGINPCHVGRLPVQLAAMNMTNINVQLLTIEAAATRSKEKIYQAAMLEPHTAAELNIDDIKAMCDELIEAQGN